MARTGTTGLLVAAALLLTTTGATAQEAADVEVVDVAFEPSDVTIEAGGTVTWTQTGSLPHTVTADDGSFDSHPDCSGGSDCMASGDTFSQTFDEPGTYAYYCRIHGGPGGTGMAGTVTVTAAGATPTDTATPTETGTPTEDAPPTTGDISVSDQTGDGTTVTVDEVTISGADGFVVVHLDADGAPGPVIGHAPVDEGTSTDVVVTLDEPLADATVWPMLHVDAGVLGTYEFPGADVPVTADGQVVVASLAYTVDDPADADTGDDELAQTGPATALWLLALALVLTGSGMVAARRRTS